MLSRKITISFLVVVGLVLIGTGIILWNRSRVGQQLDLEIKGPQQVLLGVPLDINVSVVNKSRSILEDSRLTITLPEGATFVGSSVLKNTEFRELGSIGSGSVLDERFKIMFLSGENSIKRIEANLTYSPSTIGASFEKETDFDISVGKSALSLDLATPQKVLSGEDFEITLEYENKSNIDYSDLKLRLEYPNAFTFNESSLEPDENNNLWRLGSLRPGSRQDFTVGGSLSGPDNSFFEIRGFIEAEFSGEKYTVTETLATISISPSPLSLQVSLNETKDFISGLNERLNYVLSYANSTDVALRDVIITAKVIGDMFNLSTIGSNGIFRSLDNTILWNAATNPELALVKPGQSGTVGFSIRTKDNYPISRLGDRNFALKVLGTIESPTVPYFLAADRTIGLANIETKVQGAVDIDAQVLFRDAASGVINQGPFPPKANTSTQFSVHWIITNFSTDIKNVEVRTFLEGDTKFLRIVKSNIDSLPVYNDRRQELVWNIDSIGATKGILSEPVEVIFQIETVPSLNMVGRAAPLMRETTITATDDFTNVQLTDSDIKVTTKLHDDPTVSGNQGAVLP